MATNTADQIQEKSKADIVMSVDIRKQTRQYV